MSLGEREHAMDRRELVDVNIDPDALWSRFGERRRRRESRRRAMMAATMLAAAAALIAIITWPRADRWVGTTLTTPVALSVSLDDGTLVHAEAGASLERVSEEDDEVRIRIDEGRARFDVARNEARAFIVMANDVEVRVVGTEFTVASDPPRVQVTRGAVDVRLGEEVWRLTAGDTWDRPEEPAEVLDVAPVRDESEQAEVEPEAPELETPVRVRRRRAVPAEEEPAGPTSQELFMQARAARRNGNASGAAALYTQFLRSHPEDANAGLVAFELGRLRMDVLQQPGQAVGAFRQALRLGAGAFHQDARARLVEVLDNMGRTEECQRERERYLSAYPSGRHLEQVRSACP